MKNGSLFEVAPTEPKIAFTLANLGKVLTQPVTALLPAECHLEMTRVWYSFKYFKEMNPPDSLCLLCSKWLDMGDITCEDLNQVLESMQSPDVVAQCNFFQQFMMLLGQRVEHFKRMRQRQREKANRDREDAQLQTADPNAHSILREARSRIGNMPN